MTKMNSSMQNAFWYLISTVSANLLALISVPILLRSLGGDAWSDIIVAQSIGTIIAFIVDLGYSHFAPTILSSLDESDRKIYFTESIRKRSFIFIPLILIVLCFEASKVTNFGLGGILIILAFSSQGLSSSWLIVSRGAGSKYFRYITLPRILGLLLGTLACLYFRTQISFAIPLLIGNILSVRYNFPKLRNLALHKNKTTNHSSKNIRDKSVVRVNFVNSLLINIMQQVPVVLISVVSPGILIQYALADKIIKAFLGVTWPAIAVIQGHQNESEGKNSFSSRKFTGFTRLDIITIVSVFCVIAIPFLVQYFVTFASDALVQFSLIERCMIGQIVALSFINSVLSSFYLVRSEKTQIYLRTNLIGTPVFLLALLIASIQHSLTIFLATLLTVISVNTLILYRISRI